MDIGGLEALAVETYERHGLDPARPVSTLKLARLVLKDEKAIERAPLISGSRPAMLYRVNGRRRIAVSSHLAADELRHRVGHELGHVLLDQEHTGDPELEAACDYLGAALVAPRPAIIALHREFGWELEEIADHLVSTQTLAALRIAEADVIPLAAVSPLQVRVRGPEDFVWPEERTIRGWAKRPGPGLRKVAVTDRPRRSVLLADG